jgi:hypothetical protein
MTDQDIQTKSGMTVLVMPNPHPDDGRENPLANLDFGPAGTHSEDHDSINIVFREDEPGVGRAIIRNDHPLLERLFQKYPQVRIEDGGPETIYLCSVCDDGREFAGKPQLRSHMAAHRRRRELEPKEG